MSISIKAPLISLILVFLSATAIAIITYLQYDALTARLQEEGLSQLTETEAERLDVSLHELSHDILWFGGLTKTMVNEYHIRGRDQLGLMLEFCQHLLKSKPNYDQIRILAKPPEGQEVLRVNRQNDQVVRVKEQELQSKGHRDYYLEAQNLTPGTVYFSEINLNREQGDIEVPHKPTLRTIVKLENLTESITDMIVINQNFGTLLESLYKERNPQFQYYLMNEDGEFLLHPDSACTFRFDFGESHRVQDDFPGVEPFFEGNARHFNLRLHSMAQTGAQLLHLYRFYPFPDSSERALIFGIIANNRDLATGVHTIALRSFFGILIMLILTSIIAFLLSAHLVRPVLRITKIIRGFGLKEDPVETLPVEARDEVGELARAFEKLFREIKDREARILKMNNKLEIANTDLRHFTHVSSHELREPVQRVCILTDMLKDPSVWKSAEERDGLLDKLENESDVMLAQITQFSEFAQLEEVEYVRSSVNLEQVVEQVLRLHRAAIEQYQVEIQIDALPTIIAYPQMVLALYEKAVDNALKYAHTTPFVLRFTAIQKNSMWELGIYNTGSTIEPEYRNSVFSPFIRLEKKTPGGGMGLAICKRIVNRHAGRIWIEGNENSTHLKFVIY